MAPKDQPPPDTETTQRVAPGRPAGAGAFGYASLAPILFENGYEPIPIRPDAKVPAVTRWSSVPIGEEQIADWSALYPDHGVGLRTGTLVGFDIDLLDADCAHSAMEVATRHLGPAPMRVGRWPKRLLMYRTEAPFPKIGLPSLDVLGVGQQFVAFGRHPATGRPYDWPEGETPLEIALGDLAPVTAESIASCLGEIAALLPGLEPLRRSRRARAAGEPASGPVRDAAGFVTDGRDAWLSQIAFHAVHDGLENGDTLDARRDFRPGLAPVRGDHGSRPWQGSGRRAVQPHRRAAQGGRQAQAAR